MVYKSNKRVHFEELRETTNFEFHEMLFFDNEEHNVRSVEGLGVKCVHCVDGITEDVWNEGMDLF